MKIRATLHVDGRSTALLVCPVMQETTEHVLLKLAAAVLFAKREPILSPSSQHPALRDQDFLPDLVHVNDHNEVTLWIECGGTTLHKMEKVAKRYRDARLIVLTATPVEGATIKENLPQEPWNRWEIFAFPHGEFARWKQLIRESNDLIGEADERSMNLVVNEEMYVMDLETIG